MRKKQKRTTIKVEPKKETTLNTALEEMKNMPTNALPIPAKVTAVHTLHKDLKVSLHNIVKLLGIPERTVCRYLSDYVKPNESQWQIYSTTIKKVFEHKENDLQARVLLNLEEKIPQARFYELTGLYKILSDAKREDRKVSIHSDKTMVFQVVKDTK